MKSMIEFEKTARLDEITSARGQCLPSTGNHFVIQSNIDGFICNQIRNNLMEAIVKVFKQVP